jgi:hypothetical protein
MGKRTVTSLASIARLAGLALCACTNPVQTGELGNGEFLYSCTGAADSACGSSSAGQSTQLPAQVAVGASFSVTYSPATNNDTTIEGSTGYTVLAASPDMAQGFGDSLVAQRTGYVALLARHNGTQNIDDFVNIHMTPIAQVVADQTEVALSAGDVHTITLRPLDTQGGDLAGQIACTWSITGAAQVVVLQASSTTGSVSVEGVGAGTTTVHALCGGASTDVTFDVTGSIGDDAGSDAGTGGETGATDGGTHG